MSETKREVQQENQLAVWIFLAAIVPLSPIMMYLPVHGNIFSLACSFWIFIRYFRFRFDASVYLIVLITLVLAALPAIYWNGLKLVALPVYFIAALMLVSRLNEQHIRRFAEVSSRALLVILAGCVVGFLYALAGGQALLDFANPDTRELIDRTPKVAGISIGGYGDGKQEPGALHSRWSHRVTGWARV